MSATATVSPSPIRCRCDAAGKQNSNTASSFEWSPVLTTSAPAKPKLRSWLTGALALPQQLLEEAEADLAVGPPLQLRPEMATQALGAINGPVVREGDAAVLSSERPSVWEGDRGQLRGPAQMHQEVGGPDLRQAGPACLITSQLA